MKKLLPAVLSITVIVSLSLTAQTSEASINLMDITTFSSTGTTPAEDLVAYNGLWGSNVQWLSGFGDFVIWTHHFEFTPPAAEILNAQLFVTLYDDEADTSFLKKEFGFGWGEDFTFDIGEVDAGVYSYSINGSYLTDGKYTVKVASLGGDFGISQSKLSIDYNPEETNAIPEPATMLLFSSGLLGGAYFRKKRR